MTPGFQKPEGQRLDRATAAVTVVITEPYPVVPFDDVWSRPGKFDGSI
jgi:hypothetical protein